METLFLETTIQVNKFLGKKENKEKIKQICIDKELISSTYVLGEFKSNFLKDATTLYNLLVDSQDTEEALIRLEEVYSKRVSNRMTKVFANIARDVGFVKEEVLDRLECYIEDLLVKRFYDGLTTMLINDTKCSRSLAKPQKESGCWRINVSCRKRPKPNCSIFDFLLSDNKNELKKIKDLPEHLSKVEEIIVNIVSEDDMPYGNNCRTLGDLIISLEAPDKSKIYTTNIKDFKPICDKLELEIIE